MTSEAKVGLLLGLSFIFIIAFLINGLPKADSETNNNQLTGNMIRTRPAAHGLAAKERKAVSQTKLIEKRYIRQSRPSPKPDKSIRFHTALPKSISSPGQTPETTLPAQNKPAAAAKPNKTALPKFYIVKRTDTLASIAKKFYGPREGNKTANIDRIFKANSAKLNDPDEIYEGQNLIIPPLRPSSYTTSSGGNTTSAAIPVKDPSNHYTSSQSVKQNNRYIVRQGDSLWRIAAERLGDASRYTEIAGLNREILGDENNLIVGMRLKLPAR